MDNEKFCDIARGAFGFNWTTVLASLTKLPFHVFDDIRVGNVELTSQALSVITSRLAARLDQSNEFLRLTSEQGAHLGHAS